MNYLNDARARAIFFGAAGGFLGAMAAEALVGNPQSFAATLFFGCLSGLGIGAAFGLSEGVGAGAVRLGTRAAVIGGILGFLGGGFGSGLGQAVSSAGGREESVFSGEMARRLQDAGARSGEIEVGLIWRDRNDLDLHVWDPNGEEVYWKKPLSRSGGELDVDRNAMCRNPTVTPVEHIVWGDNALHGKYRIGVDYFDQCELVGGPSAFEVEVIVGGQSRSFQGVLAKGDPLAIVHEFEYTGTAIPAAEGGGFGKVLQILGWLVFGLLVGVGQGVSRRAIEAVRNLALGGAVGGLVGGFGFVVLVGVASGGGWARFVGMAIVGAMIGICMVVAEQALTSAIFVANGRYEGRRIPLDRERLRLGRDELAEIYLGGDPSIARCHCEFVREGNSFTVQAVDAPVEVNGNVVSQSGLVDGDRLRIGQTSLVFRSQASDAIPAGRRESADDVRAGSQASFNAASRSSAGATQARKAPPPPPPPRRRP